MCVCVLYFRRRSIDRKHTPTDWPRDQCNTIIFERWPGTTSHHLMAGYFLILARKERERGGGGERDQMIENQRYREQKSRYRRRQFFRGVSFLAKPMAKHKAYCKAHPIFSGAGVMADKKTRGVHTADGHQGRHWFFIYFLNRRLRRFFFSIVSYMRTAVYKDFNNVFVFLQTRDESDL